MADDRGRFADVLGQAIQDRSLALDRIAARLRRAGVPVSVATLSYWQTGRSRPTRARSIRAVEELERILDVPSGHLISALPGEAIRVDPITLLPGSATTKQLLIDRGISLNRNWSRLSIHDTMRVNADRTEASTLTRLVMRAEDDNVSAWPLIFYQDSDSASEPSVESVSSCTVGETQRVQEQNVILVTMLLPRALRRGELAMVEYLITWGETSDESYRIERSLPAPVGSLVLDVEFDCPAPSKITSYLRPSMDHEALENQRRVRMLGHHAQYVVSDPSIGIHGMSWEWS